VLLSLNSHRRPDRICVYTAYVTTSQQCPACVELLPRDEGRCERGLAALCNLVMRFLRTVVDLGISG